MDINPFSSTMLIIVVDLLGLYIIIRFLAWKVRHKLEEVEQRQQFSNYQKKKARSNRTSTTESE
ncbi:MAG: hypothetical protein L7U62_05800 [Candidatus Poseidoniaceae archaeon]|nr:hypothetical protein [Candidatus Poseidoniaceae archaeon]